MEPEASLPCLQEPANCLCLEPDESSLHPFSLFLVRATLIFFFHLRPDFLSGSFFFSFSHQNSVYIYVLPHMCYSCMMLSSHLP